MNSTSVQEEKQLVVLNLGSEAFGVDIARVREIIRMLNVTKVPRTPDFVEGVINLRGKVIPVVNLRSRFGLPLEEQTRENRIVVVDIGGQDIGIIVDSVNEVLRISTEVVEPLSEVMVTAASDYLMGIAKLKDRLIILLDLGKVLSDIDKKSCLDISPEAGLHKN